MSKLILNLPMFFSLQAIAYPPSSSQPARSPTNSTPQPRSLIPPHHHSQRAPSKTDLARRSPIPSTPQPRSLDSE
ncbi:MAG: hypothetical protein WBM44_03640 [Waterburya sp.]